MENKLAEIHKKIEELSEDRYREFNKKLLPGIEDVAGVRLPALRNRSRKASKNSMQLCMNT